MAREEYAAASSGLSEGVATGSVALGCWAVVDVE